MCIRDRHTGVLEAMKLGAVPTFILGDSEVEILEAGEVPAGVILPVEPALLSRKLWDKDRVVMVSDGVLDAWPGENKTEGLREFLEGVRARSAQELAEKILKFACKNGSGGRDDMTVLVAEVWKR